MPRPCRARSSTSPVVSGSMAGAKSTPRALHMLSRNSKVRLPCLWQMKGCRITSSRGTSLPRSCPKADEATKTSRSGHRRVSFRARKPPPGTAATAKSMAPDLSSSMACRDVPPNSRSRTPGYKAWKRSSRGSNQWRRAVSLAPRAMLPDCRPTACSSSSRPRRNCSQPASTWA